MPMDNPPATPRAVLDVLGFDPMVDATFVEPYKKTTTEWKENEHPRARDGEFTSTTATGGRGGAGSNSITASQGGRASRQQPPAKKAATAASNMVSARFDAKKKRWLLDDGSPVPEHIQKIGIPPAWRDVRVNLSPEATVVATGRDAKNRSQSKYSATHAARAAAIKFGRVAELRKKRAAIFRELDHDATDAALRENAECLKLIMQVGIRPGSDNDTKADYKSFGATTLEGRHVKVSANGIVSLKFVSGKNKGREIELPVGDHKTAAMLLRRAKTAGAGGRLFDTDATRLREYSKDRDGKGFKTKDHRTALGTEVAIREIASRKKPPATTREYKQAVKEVAEVVARTLGNTPSVALKSYIDPSVFASLKV